MNYTEKIKFGILCNGISFEAWEVACINHLLEHPQIELKLLVVNDSESKAKLHLLQKIIQYPYRNFLYRAYKRFILKAKSFHVISLEEQFKSIPKLYCKTLKKGKYSEFFNDNDIKAIQSYGLDFMLRFGFNIIKGDILESCKYGIWSFHHADNDYIRGGPIGFWEIFLKRNTTAAVLQQLTSKLDEGHVLRKGYLKTIDHSYAENIDQLTEMTATWPLQVCIDILNGHQNYTPSISNFTHAKLYKYPKNWQFLWFVFKLIKNKLLFHFEQLFMAESWQIALIDNNVFFTHELSKIEYLSQHTSEIYQADPFLWPNRQNELMLFEYFSYSEQRGKIAMSDTNGEHFKVLDFGTNLHMSYPFCFEHDEVIYCVPEQAALNKVTLYQLGIDGKVSKVKDLITDFAARDSTLIFYENKWWLFCTKANYFENAALFIFYADSLFDDFKSHLNNPVKVDVQNARPAGNLFVKENKLYRPAQNSAKHYGHSVNLNEVIELSHTHFREKMTSTIEAHQFGNYIGIHHAAHQQGKTLVDLKKWRFSWFNFKIQVARKMSRLLGKN
jgi:hypothetical protein